MLQILGRKRERNLLTDWTQPAEEKGHLKRRSQKKLKLWGLAKKEAAELISQANLRANQMVEDAKSKAQEEADRIKESAEKDVVQSMNKAREGLRSEVAVLAVAGAEKLLKAEIDQEANATLIDEIAGEL